MKSVVPDQKSSAHSPRAGAVPPCPISSADKAHCNVYRWALSLGRSRCRPAMAPYMSSMRALAASRRSCYAARDVAGLGALGSAFSGHTRPVRPVRTGRRAETVISRLDSVFGRWRPGQPNKNCCQRLACTDHDGRPAGWPEAVAIARRAKNTSTAVARCLAGRSPPGDILADPARERGGSLPV